MALNSGLFWPRRTFMRYPGTLVVEFLDPLPPGLPRNEFIARISSVIEDATKRLVEAARGSRRGCSAGCRFGAGEGVETVVYRPSPQKEREGCSGVSSCSISAS